MKLFMKFHYDMMIFRYGIIHEKFIMKLSMKFYWKIILKILWNLWNELIKLYYEIIHKMLLWNYS